MAVAKEVSPDAAVASVLSKLDGIFTFNVENKTLSLSALLQTGFGKRFRKKMQHTARRSPDFSAPNVIEGFAQSPSKLF